MTTQQDALQDLVRISEELGLYDGEFNDEGAGMKELTDEQIDDLGFTARIHLAAPGTGKQAEAARKLARAAIAADRALNATADLEHQPAGTPVAWLLTDKKINDIQVDSVQRLIDRARQAHFTDLIIRINGKDEHYQADWLKHLVRAEAPVCAPADRDVMRQTLEGIANAEQGDWDKSMRDDSTFKIWAQSRARYALAAPHTPPAEQPIDMVLHCPECGMQHIDAPESERTAYADGHEAVWRNPPHRSHLCHGCGYIWRPADVPTNGVAAIKTKGKDDSTPAEQPGDTLSPVYKTADELITALDAEQQGEQEPIIYKRSAFTKNWTTFNVRTECADAAEARLKSQALAETDPDMLTIASLDGAARGKELLLVELRAKVENLRRRHLAWSGASNNFRRAMFYACDYVLYEIGVVASLPEEPEPSTSSQGPHKPIDPSGFRALRAKVEALPADSDRPGFVWRKTVLAEIDKMGGGV